MKQLTKLQKEFIDKETNRGSYIAFPLNIFKSEEYRNWKRKKRNILIKPNEP